ncbi:dna-directed rna polymerases i ii and iii subunit rpabc2 [Holotrichia oblita]|uniref:Dna-directed rna polymerases i ii and iii subunit rpabc2 n=1 Tax=Holotrichia oblita TaxID=644536 RepID=A0ACB9SVG6_HOLOL|nr:dna-directed rna polymerases i ii and iii subunit rpabc2 [Holotrichia oblita]
MDHYISVTPIKRRRSQQNIPKKRSFSAHYFLPTRVRKTSVNVCQPFFLQALNVNKDRVNNVANIIFNGNAPKENRGGDRVRKKSALKKESVRQFLNKLESKESHYNRAKSKRIYISSELGIKKLHEVYENGCDTENCVSFQMFRRIFINEFNIRFSSPASDCCAKCTNLKYQIKAAKDEKKNDMKSELKIHKKRANAFYALLKQTPPNSKTFCFDLQHRTAPSNPDKLRLLCATTFLRWLWRAEQKRTHCPYFIFLASILLIFC